MAANREKQLEKLWYFSIFAFFVLWFTQVHPVVIFDADDWTYLVPDRKAWPIWGEWNPAKVFPEVFMPFCSTIGAYLLLPVVKDYVNVMTITHGLVIAGFLTLYAWSFGAMLQRVLDIKGLPNKVCTALFLLLHFLALRSQETDNEYLFLCADLNCYYNYLIPALLNGSIVLWMVNNDRLAAFWAGDKYLAKGACLLILYMAIFSNLVDSVILAVYAGAVLLVDFLKGLKTFKIKEFIKKNAFLLTLFGVWFVSAVFELSGGRATTSEGASGSLLKNFKDALYYLFQVLLSCNGLFLALSIAAVAGAAWLWWKSRKEESTFFALMLLWAVGIAAMVVVMVVLCGAVDPVYMMRSEYLFGIFFYCLVFVMLCLGFVIRKCPKILLVLPLLLCILLSETNTRGRTFQESNMENLDPKICADVSRSLLAQILEADAQGKTELTLHVPKWDSADNWPHALVLIHRISYPLYEHGVISRPIALDPVATWRVE